ncbi:hypothetical protein ADK75_06465 [Streptomyces virginiae]|uniref:Uncharacterized protein n=1 Tax=Streptomyces virginiae TaxID=1961 RepID=A0A0L8N254_STRVG|nr:hypothetical protein [Streptomyces virginiae]KOG56759.1 hypothetical protein ADK75_06465 [Streptomyces virginiae]
MFVVDRDQGVRRDDPVEVAAQRGRPSQGVGPVGCLACAGAREGRRIVPVAICLGHARDSVHPVVAGHVRVAGDVGAAAFLWRSAFDTSVRADDACRLCVGFGLLHGLAGPLGLDEVGDLLLECVFGSQSRLMAPMSCSAIVSSLSEAFAFPRRVSISFFESWISSAQCRVRSPISALRAIGTGATRRW